MRYTVFLAAACVLTLLSGGVEARAETRQCATAEERAALDFKAMQSELMVAALTCGKQAEYNRFVTGRQSVMPDNGRHIKAYFSRVYRENASASLNSFVTALANFSSQVSLNVNRDDYCRKAGTMFRLLQNGADAGKMSRFFSHLHRIQTCGRGVS